MNHCYSIIEVFGLCGNILVILTVYSGRRRFQANYYRLVFHLSICDMLLLLTGNLIFTVGPWIENQYLSSNLGTVSCVIISPLIGCLFTTEPGKRCNLSLHCFTSYSYFSVSQHFSHMQEFASSGVCSNKWEDNTYFYIYGWVVNIAVTLVSMVFLIVLYAKMCYLLALHQQKFQEIIFSTNNQSLQKCGEKINHKSSTFAH